MQQLLVIAGGGAIGAVLRFLMSSSLYRILGRDFPYGTLMVNIVGSLLMGLIFILLLEKNVMTEQWRSAIFIGFLGAFTTFSTFSFETINLFEAGEFGKAILNILLSVVLCLGATWFGMFMAKQLT